MKYPILILILTLFLSACSDPGTPPAASGPSAETEQSTVPESGPPSDGQTVPEDQPAEIVQDSDATDAGSTWQRSKEYGAEALEKSKELYEDAKQKSGEVSEAVVESSRSAWQATKETTGEVMDKAKDLGQEAIEQSKLYYDSARDKAGEIGEALKEKSLELYDRTIGEPGSEPTTEPDPATVHET